MTQSQKYDFQLNENQAAQIIKVLAEAFDLAKGEESRAKKNNLKQLRGSIELQLLRGKAGKRIGGSNGIIDI
jgi:hypothetical protein